MKQVKGDLIKLAEAGEFDAIIHGCNCFCNMGAGIAKTIKQKYPNAYTADLSTRKGDESKLGTYSFSDEGKFVILNAYTQYNWGGRKGTVNADYKAIRSVFRSIRNTFSGSSLRVGYPMIGAGLAGGDWDIISNIIDQELKVLDHTLVIWDK